MNQIRPYHEVIKERRLALGLTLEQVCEGICSAATLSRIEKGRLFTISSRAGALLERLDLADDFFYTLLGRRELEMEDLRDDIVIEGTLFFREKGAPRREARERALAKLQKLEELRERDDNITEQFIAAQRVLFTEPEGDQAWLERGEALTELLRMTQPRFRSESLKELRLSVFELELAAHAAYALANGGALDEARGLSEQLEDYCSAHFEGRQQALGSIYIFPFLRLALPLREKKWAEALALADSCRKVASPQANYALPEVGMLTEIMARCQLELGETDAARELYRQAYALNLALLCEGRAQAVAGEARERLGLVLAGEARV